MLEPERDEASIDVVASSKYLVSGHACRETLQQLNSRHVGAGLLAVSRQATRRRHTGAARSVGNSVCHNRPARLYRCDLRRNLPAGAKSARRLLVRAIATD